jgi:hypothetical protein
MCSETLFGFAPVTRRRKVTFDPAGTAPNGLRNFALKMSWSRRIAALAGAWANNAVATTTDTINDLDPMTRR